MNDKRFSTLTNLLLCDGKTGDSLGARPYTTLLALGVPRDLLRVTALPLGGRNTRFCIAQMLCEELDLQVLSSAAVLLPLPVLRSLTPCAHPWSQ